MKRSEARVATAFLTALSLGLGGFVAGSSTGNLGIMIGQTISGAVVPALIPVIWWACVLFRSEKASGPLALWLGLLVIVGGVTVVPGQNHGSALSVSPSESRVVRVCPFFSEFCVEFPGEPRFRVVELFSSHAADTDGVVLEGHRYEYETSGGTYLRAEFLPFSHFPPGSLSDAELREFGRAFALGEGLQLVEIFVERRLGRRIIVVRGSKHVDGVTVKIFNHFYRGDGSAIHLVAAGIASSFPTRASSDFLRSVHLLR